MMMILYRKQNNSTTKEGDHCVVYRRLVARFFLDVFRQLSKMKINRWSTVGNDRNNEGTEYRKRIHNLMNAISIIVEKQIKTENRSEHRSTKNNK